MKTLLRNGRILVAVLFAAAVGLAACDDDGQQGQMGQQQGQMGQQQGQMGQQQGQLGQQQGQQGGGYSQ